MTLTYRNGVSIGEIILYIPALAIAIFLCIKHGFGRSSGWYFLIVLSLARIIGAAMELATISSPKSVSLYTGSAILTNVGFSPLVLAALGLLSRLSDSIRKSYKTIVDARMLRMIELVIFVGLILGIVGGVNAGSNFSKTGHYTPSTLNKVGTALLVVSFGFIIISIIFISFATPHAEQGEHRLFYAVVAALPFLTCRLVYSCYSTFSHNKNFNLITGNTTILLCVALLEELAVVIIFEGVGLTLKKVEHVLVSNRDPSEPLAQGQSEGEPWKKENMALRIFRHTILGRVVMAFVGNKDEKYGDVEMHGQK
ncbi:hypothetical protein LHYA1_G005025 [Lachnellula hyalina]|uniref:DUF7702 domain-containing protein n=1 Tax=Lachnellula hyalina TaxID=1316788 RepID=A0A8H8R326_9HELO|nr:uncharacterized protein LHYA1_G005025 [Lachnellula hyalina]TVY25999.1 hypothetical protein LHYA1_G005025 [Lachnellula hyalina]